MNNLKMMVEEKDVLTKKLDALIIEFETANISIKALEQTHDTLIFDGANTDISLVELTTATIHRNSLRRVINDIEKNMIPAADEKVEAAQEEVIKQIRAAQQLLYDRCAESILKKMSEVSKIIQSFDSECEKAELEAGLVIGRNHPVFYVQESDRVQYI
jgi:hypothetical protein